MHLQPRLPFDRPFSKRFAPPHVPWRPRRPRTTRNSPCATLTSLTNWLAWALTPTTATLRCSTRKTATCLPSFRRCCATAQSGRSRRSPVVLPAVKWRSQQKQTHTLFMYRLKEGRQPTNLCANLLSLLLAVLYDNLLLAVAVVHDLPKDDKVEGSADDEAEQDRRIGYLSEGGKDAGSASSSLQEEHECVEVARRTGLVILENLWNLGRGKDDNVRGKGCLDEAERSKLSANEGSNDKSNFSRAASAKACLAVPVDEEEQHGALNVHEDGLAVGRKGIARPGIVANDERVPK
mmetsp:Transcript_16935/g.52952  ORF Transcript_16935/g.52952 Transcript_16935/m.52952 type:complete len:293 (+) Transcript_16935:468-1346(+)